MAALPLVADPPERWAALPTWLAPGYFVSTLGRIRYGTELRRPRRAGGVTPHLYIEFHRTPVRSAPIAKLVADAFLGPCPEGMRLRFKDDDGCNARLDNLEYGPYCNYHLRARYGSREKKRPKVRVDQELLAILPPARFEHGLAFLPDRCPNCGAPVAQEPAVVHCVLCGRIWPIRGGRLDAQAKFEAVVGAATAEASYPLHFHQKPRA